METVVSPQAEAELQLLTKWGDPFERSRSRQAGVLSVLVHAALIAVLIWLPAEIAETPQEKPLVEHITPLIEPPTVLTQKAPNKGPVAKRFNAAELAPRPRVQAPPGVPAAPTNRAAAPASLPPAPAPKQVAAASPPPAPPEPPKVETPPKETPRPVTPPVVTPPPQIQSEEHRAGSPFENPTTIPPSNPNAKSPFGNPVDEALNHVSRTPDGHFIVGDPGIPGLRSQSIPPGIGSPGSAVELLTDTQGVDFKPYLFRVLNLVRQHWQAIIPESVTRLGLRGTVAIQFAIDRQGLVPKLVFVPGRKSGSDSLDRAAVAGISASVPFPPLPSDFKGDRIVLQFEFAYNMPKK
jgi:TonB family protein